MIVEPKNPMFVVYRMGVGYTLNVEEYTTYFWELRDERNKVLATSPTFKSEKARNRNLIKFLSKTVGYTYYEGRVGKKYAVGVILPPK